jgi:alpha-tubulin suppressor-like RCC1 family protein
VLAVVPALPMPAVGAAAVRALPAAAVKPGETVLAWGANVYGELGNGTTTSSTTPAPVMLPAGYHYTVVRCQLFGLARTTSGRVFAWGLNDDGELGDGTTLTRLTPVAVKLPRGVKVTTVRAGVDFVLALTSTGKILAWGNNSKGQLGNGTTVSRRLPVPVKLPNGVTVKAISAGDDNGLALTTAGRLLSWGGNEAGQLGDGTRKGRLVPGSVKLPPHTSVTSIAAGNNVGFAVTSAGRLLAWGANGQGTLGDGTTTSRSTPVQVKLPKGVKVVAASGGLLHVLALTAGGRVLAWGYNVAGQLGDGTTTNRHVPVWVKLPKGVTVRALAAGKFYSMALTANHRILAWGSNDGDLGDGSDTNSPIPVRVHLPGGFTATGIGAGISASTGLAIGHQMPA